MENFLQKAWFDAIINNDHAQVEKLIEQGVDVNIQDADGQTALHIAADKAQSELVFILLCNKANVHAKDNCGNNALHIAALKGHQETVQYLIEYGVDNEFVKHLDVALDLLVFNNDGKTARMIALEHGQIAIAKLLKEDEWYMAIAKNAIQHVKKMLQETISVDMQDNGLRLAIRWQHMEIIELFLLNGFNVNIQNLSGETAFYLAIGIGNRNIIELLLKHGAYVHTTNIQGETLLHCAAACGHKEIVELLIERGVYKHAKNRKEETILHLACKYGQLDVIELLLKYDIDINACSRLSRTALDYVLDRSYDKELYDKIADLLIAHGAQEQRSI